MTDTMPERQATRWRCSLSISVHCGRGNGQPSRKRCGYCGGTFYVEQGWWGVFVWTGDGRYPHTLAVKVFSAEGPAERYAVRTDSRYVVRWIAA
jgi:hypothetical protein